MSDAPPLPATSADSPAPLAPPAPSVDIAPKPQVTTMSDANGNGSATPVGTQPAPAAIGDRAGGSQARVFLNDKIVPHLLEGMKLVAREKPAEPLRALGEFLIQRSSQVENGIKTEPE